MKILLLLLLAMGLLTFGCCCAATQGSTEFYEASQSPVLVGNNESHNDTGEVFS